LANIVQKETNILAEHGFMVWGTTGNSVGAFTNELAWLITILVKSKALPLRMMWRWCFLCAIW
jgi:hypothetical protein